MVLKKSRLKTFSLHEYKIAVIASLQNDSRVVKPTLNKIMPCIILSAFFCIILFNGCTSSAENIKTSYDPDYKVLDRGKLDVIVKSRACALIAEDAVSGAKRNAQFHLRSVIGDQNHRREFQEVKRYNEGQKICVEMNIAALPPL